MANEQDKPAKPRGRGKQVAGIVLFWMGIVGILFFAGAMFVCIDSGSNPDYIPLAVIAGAVFWISLLLVVMGAIMYHKGRSQAKKQ